MTEMPKSSPATPPQIELWMDNWAWAPVVSEEVAESSEDPDAPEQTPLGLHKMGLMFADLIGEYEKLRKESLLLKDRITQLEGQMSDIQSTLAKTCRSESQNG